MAAPLLPWHDEAIPINHYGRRLDRYIQGVPRHPYQFIAGSLEWPILKYLPVMRGKDCFVGPLQH